MLMLAGGVFLDPLLYYQKEGLWVLEIPELFNSCSLTLERWCSLIFPWIVWCLRDHYEALSSGFRVPFPHVSLFTKDDDSGKTATAQCCFWQKWFWHFRSIATSSIDGIYHEANIALEAGLAKFCFSVLCWSCFTHGNKAPWFLFRVL